MRPPGPPPCKAKPILPEIANATGKKTTGLGWPKPWRSNPRLSGEKTAPPKQDAPETK